MTDEHRELKVGALHDVVRLPVSEAAGEDADLSCTVSLQPFLINWKTAEHSVSVSVWRGKHEAAAAHLHSGHPPCLPH